MVKKILLMMFVLAVSFATASAQNKNPMDAVQVFTVNGIKVILSPNENQLVSVIFGTEGGIASGETENPALAPITAEVLASSGSQMISKDDLRTYTSRTSTSYNAGGDLRGINISMTSTLPNFEKSFDILVSMMATPNFDEAEFTKIKKQRTNAAMGRWARPEGYSMTLADSMIKQNNPVLSKWTSPENVSAIDLQMIRDFHKRIAERSRMLLVIVGNVKRSDIESKLQKLTTLPTGSYTRKPIPPIEPASQPKMQKVDRPQQSTAYIYSGFAGPRASEKDYWAMQVGFSYLRDKLFEEVRTKRNLSYAPGGFITSSLGNGVGYVSVSTVYPDSSIDVMYKELRKMKTGDFGDEEVDMAKSGFATGYFMSQMTNGGKASALFSGERNAGSWKFAFSADAINSITKADIQKVFAKYAKNLQVGFVGKTAGVTDAKFLFTE